MKTIKRKVKKCIDCLNMKKRTFNKNTILDCDFKDMKRVLRKLQLYGEVTVYFCIMQNQVRKVYVHPSVTVKRLKGNNCRWNNPV